jgi:hypothetical protein
VLYINNKGGKNKMDKIELELQKRICQANVVGTVLLIAAFVIPIFAVGSVNWIAEGAFKLPGQSDFVFCFVGTFIISVFASVFFILSGITKKILKNEIGTSKMQNDRRAKRKV